MGEDIKLETFGPVPTFRVCPYCGELSNVLPCKCPHTIAEPPCTPTKCHCSQHGFTINGVDLYGCQPYMIPEQQKVISDLRELLEYVCPDHGPYQGTRCPQCLGYELVDPDNISNESGWAKTAEPALSLLVIDLGDSCVVKVESKADGEFTFPAAPNGEGTWHLRPGQSALTNRSFAEFRSAIDALEGEKPEAPCPRLERMVDNSTGEPYYDVYGGRGYIAAITASEYDALSAVAGHPLPVWEPKKGHWEQCTTFAPGPIDMGITKYVKVWRYTR